MGCCIAAEASEQCDNVRPDAHLEEEVFLQPISVASGPIVRVAEEFEVSKASCTTPLGSDHSREPHTFSCTDTVDASSPATTPRSRRKQPSMQRGRDMSLNPLSPPSVDASSFVSVAIRQSSLQLSPSSQQATEPYQSPQRPSSVAGPRPLPAYHELSPNDNVALQLPRQPVEGATTRISKDLPKVPEEDSFPTPCDEGLFPNAETAPLHLSCIEGGSLETSVMRPEGKKRSTHSTSVTFSQAAYLLDMSKNAPTQDEITDVGIPASHVALVPLGSADSSFASQRAVRRARRYSI